MRSFIALELPTEAKSAAAKIMAELKPSGANVKWVKPQGLHLTLKFLGEVDPKRLPALCQALARACAGRPPLGLGLAGVGAFPGPARPQVVWLGVTGQVPELGELASAVEKEMEGLGFAPENRPFRPHLTLGRLRRGRDKRARPDTAGLSQALASLVAFKGPDFKADKVALMKSTLTPAGAVYEQLHQIILGRAGA